MTTQQPQSLAHLQATFLELLPRLDTHAPVVFRHIRCAHRQDDAIQEMRALAWKWLARLAQRGKDVRAFPAAFVTLLALAVNSGRRLVGMSKAIDVLNPLTQRRQAFRVKSLSGSTRASHEKLYGDPCGQHTRDLLDEILHDNLRTPVPDQVQFRIDFREWLATLTPRERRLIRAMIRSERTSDLSKAFELSPGRISQLRREFQKSWCKYLAEDAG
jgi:hypothetical protein